jgi:glutamine synthetase
VGVLDRAALAEAGRAAQERLTAADVVTVACTWVDNAGVVRVKAIPVGRLEHVAAWGIGMSKVHDVFGIDDAITTSPHIGGPVGDLRLHPDLQALSLFAAQPGWAWAPVDRFTQAGQPYPPDQRAFARRMVAMAAATGLTLSMGFELEWYLCDASGAPATIGPAYGMSRLMEVADFGRDLLTALDRSGVPIEQLHPEYAAAQFEVAVAPADPVSAADRLILTRETVRAMAARYGWRASFAPVPVAGSVGNGMHLHVSVADGAHGNLLAGGAAAHGLTERGQAIVAGVFGRLPAIAALGAPSPTSHLRLVPTQWAGAYHCWGIENREAAMRLVQGVTGNQARAANFELKCVDGSANPYLVVGAVAAVIAQSDGGGATLPAPINVDPHTLPDETRPPRLPATVTESLAALMADRDLTATLGLELTGAFAAVHTADAETAAKMSDAELTEAVRWRY